MYTCACGRNYDTLPADEFTYVDNVLRHATPATGTPHDYANTGEPRRQAGLGTNARRAPRADEDDT